MIKLNEKFSAMRHFFDGDFFNKLVLIIAGVIIITATTVISILFSKSIETFIINQKTGVIFELIDTHGTRHFDNLDGISAVASWQDDNSKKRFEAFSTELSRSFNAVSAIKMFNPTGIFIWTNLPDTPVGKNENEEIAKVIKEGTLMGPASASTMGKLNTKSLLEFFVPIKSADGSVIAVIETYFDTSDITSFSRKITNFLWGVISIVLFILFFLLRFSFRRQDRKILIQSQKLQDIVKQSPFGIYTIDKSGVIETFNPAMAKISEIKDLETVVGKNILDLPLSRDMKLINLTREAFTNKPFETDTEVTLTLNSDKKYHHYQGIPIKSNKGDFVSSLLLIVEDLTKQKNLEQKLKGYTEELEKTVAERTKELESRLAELQKFQQITVARELRMIELKEQVKALQTDLANLGVKTDVPASS